MKRKLLLINPRNIERVNITDIGIKHPPLGLAVVASLTPDSWDIEILDENHDRFSFREADLVGLTGYTNMIGRAYEIAAQYRARGVPTIVGGVHASMLPEEASRFVDTVVVGEVESLWGEVTRDFENGSLKRFYRGELIDLAGMPMPRYDLLNPGYRWAPVQTSRGCPMNCEFCSVTVFNGHKYRQRPVEEVLDQLGRIINRRIFFVDDNLIGSTRESIDRAKALFEGMIKRKLGKKWLCQASINVAQDEDLLKLMSESGCRTVFIGLEAEDPDILSEINKKMNIKFGVGNYGRIFERINRYGMKVVGAFIFGMDGDTRETMLKRADYLASDVINAVQVACLTPLPGTRLMNKIRDEGRLRYNNFPEDWKYFDFMNMVFNPGRMTAEEFNETMTECAGRIYSPRTMMRKALNTIVSTRSLSAALLSTYINYALGELIKRNLSRRERGL